MTVEAPPRPHETERLVTLDPDERRAARRAEPRPVPVSSAGRSGPVRARPGAVGAVASNAHTAQLLGAEDPRFTLRRRRVTGQLLRARSMPYAVGAAAIVVLFAVLWSPLVRVGSIRVNGAVGRVQRDVLRASGITNGMALVTVSVGDARRRIERLPMVEAARVTRTWPSHVAIDVVLRQPVARVPLVTGAAAGSVALVDGRGLVIDVVPAGADAPDAGGVAPADLPQLVAGASLVAGERVDRPRADEAAVAAALGPDLRRRVRSLATDGTVIEGLVGPVGRGTAVRVRFGAATDLAAKASALRSLLADPSTGTSAVIDLSVPDAPILTPTSSKGSSAGSSVGSSVVGQ